MAAPVKSTEGTSALATVTASLGSASTSGNLLTLKVAADDYAASPPSGWTQSTGMKQETYHGGYFWWKISTGDTSVNYTIGSAANSSWVMEEYAGPFDGSPYDTSNGTLAISSAGSAATPNITPSAGDRLVLAALGSSNSSGDMSGDLTGFTNGFTHTRSSGPASATGTRDNIGGAYLDVTANGSTAYNTTGSFPFTKQSHSAMIIAFKKASGGTAYTLTADAGSVTITGTAATLGAGRKLDAATGSMAITGTAATLGKGIKLSADPGAVSISGTDVSFLIGRAVAANVGSVAIAGQDAGLNAGRLVAANGGAVTITGTDAALSKASSSVLVASAGVVTITGADVTLKVGRNIAADAGTVQIAGTDAALIKQSDARLAASSGAIIITGSNAGFSWTHRLEASPGSIVITGQPVNFIGTGGIPTVSRTITVMAESRAVSPAYEVRIVVTDAEGRAVLADQPPRIAA